MQLDLQSVEKVPFSTGNRRMSFLPRNCWKLVFVALESFGVFSKI